MPMVILTADVEDSKVWESTYRSHGDLFKAAGIGTLHYTVGDDGHVVMCLGTDDVEGYMNS